MNCLMDSSSTETFVKNLSNYFESSGSSQSLYTESLLDQQQNPSSNSVSSYSSVLNSSLRNRRFASSSATHKPVAILTPSTSRQVREAILCCLQHDVQLRVRSGGHDYEGLSYASYDQQLSFVVLDLVNFKSIEVDLKTETAWVEAGATLGQVYHSIASKSRTLAFPAGVCPTVGVGGHFSGGGYGMMSRKYGIAADHIVDAKLIDVKGNVLDRKSMGEDLFWAIRGGGAASFGIVLAWKVNLLPVPETVTVFRVTRRSDDVVSGLLGRWQRLAARLDENLLLRVTLRSVAVGQDTGSKRSTEACFYSLFLGSSDQLLPIMEKEFPELGLVWSDCKEMSWIESTLYCAGLETENMVSPSPVLSQSRPAIDILLNRDTATGYFKVKSDFVKEPMSKDGFLVMFNMLHEEDPGMAEILLSPYGGNLNGVPDNATPFPFRSGVLYNIHYAVYWARGSEDEENRHLKWIRKLYNKMGPHVTKSPRCAYLSYRDLDLGGGGDATTNRRDGSDAYYYSDPSIWGVQYFGNNFYKLVRVKAMVDPDNFFRNEQSIPPTLPPGTTTKFLAKY